MRTFTIDNESNNITAHPTAQQAKSVAGAERFATAAALAELAIHWPSARLAEIWNSLPGATPVKKFKDRATAVSRIWKAIQHLGEAVPAEATRQPALIPVINAAPVAAQAPQTPGIAPEEPPAKPGASPATTKPPVPAPRKSVRAGSRSETILDLLKRPGGASLQEIMKATNWQAHSVRGFISGTLGKKMGLKVASTKTGNGERTYALNA